MEDKHLQTLIWKTNKHLHTQTLLIWKTNTCTRRLCSYGRQTLAHADFADTQTKKRVCSYRRQPVHTQTLLISKKRVCSYRRQTVPYRRQTVDTQTLLISKKRVCSDWRQTVPYRRQTVHTQTKKHVCSYGRQTLALCTRRLCRLRSYGRQGASIWYMVLLREKS